MAHYTLPGELDGTAGVLHAYLKALRQGSAARLRGFLLFEAAARPYAGSYASEAGLTSQTGSLVFPRALARALRVGLRSRSAGWEGSVELYYRTTASYAELDVLLPLPPAPPAPLPDLELFVAGWPRFVPLASLLQQAAPPAPPPGPAPVVHAVLCVPFEPPAAFAAALEQHTRFHAALGFASTLVYLADDAFAYFEGHPALRPLLSSRQLAFARWRDAAFYAEGARRWTHMDLAWVYAHALLSFWGAPGARLLFLDVDEYLAVPSSAPVTQLLATGCLANASSWSLQRMEVFPADLAADSGPAAPLSTLTLRTASAYRPPKPLADPATTVGLDKHAAAACRAEPRLAAPRPNATVSLPHPCNPAAAALPTAPLGCAWLAHNKNMFARVRRRPAQLVPDASWQWPAG